MKKTNKTMLNVVLIFLLIFMVIDICAFAEEPEPGPCEIALYRCLFDPLNFGTAEGALHCLAGYIFCKKYIDSI